MSAILYIKEVRIIMRVEEQLKELILENYKSVRAFTTKIGIPYSTNTFFQATRFDYQHPLITLIANHCFLPTIQEHELTNSRGKGENKQSKLGELTTQKSENRMNPFNQNKLTP